MVVSTRLDSENEQQACSATKSGHGLQMKSPSEKKQPPREMRYRMWRRTLESESKSRTLYAELRDVGSE